MALTRRVDFHGLTVAVETTSESVARWLDLPFGAYPEAAPEREPDFGVAVGPSGQPGRWDVVVGDRRYSGVAGAPMAARKAEWAMVVEALRRLPGLAHVHGGVVATAAQSALLIGGSGGGKSTTSVALALAGCALYTDDVALIQRETLRPVVVPRPIKLDGRSRRLLQRFGLAVPAGARIGKCVARTALPGLPPLDVPGPPLRTAFFLLPRSRSRTSVRLMTSAEAAMHFLYHSSTEKVIPGSLDGAAFAIVNAVDSYWLTPGPLAETVSTIVEIISADR